jgi:RNA polymerase sigma-70 factor (ECF subfamily)
VNLDDHIRTAARQLDRPTDLGRAVAAYSRLEERYAAEMAGPASAAALHRRAIAVDAFLRGEEAARTGRMEEAESQFATAARYGLGDEDGVGLDVDPLLAELTAARAGDRLAAERLLREIRPFVAAICRVRIGIDDVDKLAREICICVLASLPDRPRRPVLESVHELAGRALDEHDAEPSIRVLRQSDQRRLLVTGIGRLSAKQRSVLVLRILLGLSAEETAEILDSTPGVVRVAFHQALASLRSAVGTEPPSTIVQRIPRAFPRPPWKSR